MKLEMEALVDKALDGDRESLEELIRGIRTESTG